MEKHWYFERVAFTGAIRSALQTGPLDKLIETVVDNILADRQGFPPQSARKPLQNKKATEFDPSNVKIECGSGKEHPRFVEVIKESDDSKSSKPVDKLYKVDEKNMDEIKRNDKLYDELKQLERSCADQLRTDIKNHPEFSQIHPSLRENCMSQTLRTLHAKIMTVMATKVEKEFVRKDMIRIIKNAFVNCYERWYCLANPEACLLSPESIVFGNRLKALHLSEEQLRAAFRTADMFWIQDRYRTQVDKYEAILDELEKKAGIIKPKQVTSKSGLEEGISPFFPQESPFMRALRGEEEFKELQPRPPSAPAQPLPIPPPSPIAITQPVAKRPPSPVRAALPVPEIPKVPQKPLKKRKTALPAITEPIIQRQKPPEVSKAVEIPESKVAAKIRIPKREVTFNEEVQQISPVKQVEEPELEIEFKEREERSAKKELIYEALNGNKFPTEIEKRILDCSKEFQISQKSENERQKREYDSFLKLTNFEETARLLHLFISDKELDEAESRFKSKFTSIVERSAIKRFILAKMNIQDKNDPIVRELDACNLQTLELQFSSIMQRDPKRKQHNVIIEGLLGPYEQRLREPVVIKIVLHPSPYHQIAAKNEAFIYAHLLPAMAEQTPHLIKARRIIECPRFLASLPQSRLNEHLITDLTNTLTDNQIKRGKSGNYLASLLVLKQPPDPKTLADMKTVRKQSDMKFDLTVFYQIARTLTLFEEFKFIHGDLHLNNVLLSPMTPQLRKLLPTSDDKNLWQFFVYLFDFDFSIKFSTSSPNVPPSVATMVIKNRDQEGDHGCYGTRFEAKADWYHVLNSYLGTKTGKFDIKHKKLWRLVLANESPRHAFADVVPDDPKSYRPCKMKNGKYEYNEDLLKEIVSPREFMTRVEQQLKLTVSSLSLQELAKS
jgi:hypothetical protein